MSDAKTLRMLDDRAAQMKEQAGRVQNNIKQRRVTHTKASLKRLVNDVTQLEKHLVNNNEFASKFEQMLFQAQDGPLEVTRQKGSFFIHGVVSIEALREFFVVNEPPGFVVLEIAEKGK